MIRATLVQSSDAEPMTSRNAPDDVIPLSGIRNIRNRTQKHSN